MKIPLKKVETVGPSDSHHPINWHFDRPIIPQAKKKSLLVKRLSSKGHLKKYQPHQQPDVRNKIDSPDGPDENSN